MAGEKRFRTCLFGFKKSDVNAYIEKMLKEFDDIIKEKELQISELDTKVKEATTNYTSLVHKSEQINEDRAKIAEVLIKAQEKAEVMIEDARIQAMEEKRKIENLIENEKEKLVDMKGEIKNLKEEVILTLKKYEVQLNTLSSDEKLKLEIDS